jgi:hypothetical protein
MLIVITNFFLVCILVQLMIALVWDICGASKIVEHDDWPTEFYVIGDEAFVCMNNFLTPYSGHGLVPRKDAYNFYLSYMRQCIECSFVLLVQH